MKKYLALFLSFIILASAALIGVQVYAAADADDVVYTEHTIIGDKSEIDGIELFLELHCSEHLFWDTTLTLGEEIDCDTVFSHIYNYDPPVSETRTEFELGFGLNTFGSSGSGDLLESNHFFGQYDMVADVASRTPAGETRTEIVRIADYYEYYPITASVHIGDFWFDTSHDHGYSDRKYSAQMEKLQSVLEETFRIPVLNSDLREISITKRDSGTVSEVHSSSPADHPGAYLSSLAAIADDAVYFTILPIAERDSDEVLDVSHIKGGWGIYSLPYTITYDYETPYYAESKEYVAFDLGRLSRVHPLADGITIEDFVLSEDGSTFYLTTRRRGTAEDEIMLTVIDRETMREVQSVTIFTCTPDDYVNVHTYGDNFILYKIQYSRFALIEKADGIWQTAFTVEDETISDYWSSQEFVSMSNGHTAAFDGERLVIAGYSNERGGNGMESAESSLASVYLSVYSEKGNLYTGKFTSSLDTGTFLQYNKICRPKDVSPVVLRLP